MTKTTRTPRAPRQCEIASDEGYNLAGAPVLLARLTAYIGRATFAQLAQLATACKGEYSRHNTAFMFPIDKPEARESFAQQARVILANPQPAPDAPATATAARAQSHRAARAAQSTAEARQLAAQLAAAHARAETQPDPELTFCYGSTVIHRTAQALAEEADIASREALQARVSWRIVAPALDEPID